MACPSKAPVATAEEEHVRLVQGQLVIPKRMLNDLGTLQMLLRESEDILDYIVSEDPALAQAIFAEGTQALAAFLFGQQKRKANATGEDIRRDTAIAKSKYDARVEYPDLKRENERRSRLMMKVDVNGHPVVALVDTGAELSLATSKMIRQCHLEDLVDHSYRGTVCGMGKQDIIGRIHSCVMTLGGKAFPLSLYCVEHQMSSPFLLGLDFLWRHDAAIDLRKGTLRLGRLGHEVSIDLTLKLSRVTDKLCEGGEGEDTGEEALTADHGAATNATTPTPEIECRAEMLVEASDGGGGSSCHSGVAGYTTRTRRRRESDNGSASTRSNMKGSNDDSSKNESGLALSCSICRLHFESECALRRHEAESSTHKSNLDAIIKRHEA